MGLDEIVEGARLGIRSGKRSLGSFLESALGEYWPLAMLALNVKEYLQTFSRLVYVTEMDTGTIKYINKHGREFLGIAESDIGEVKASNFYVNPEVRSEILERMENKGIRNYPVDLQTPEGVRHCEITGFPTSWFGNPYIVGSITDMTSRVEMEGELQERASTDWLTELPNRRAFMSELERTLARNERIYHSDDVPEEDLTPFSVAMIDVDRFKEVNDTFGHEVGDEVLKSVARVMKDTLRTGDMVARMGGDEFSALFYNTGSEGASQTLSRLGKNIMESDIEMPGGGPIRISSGIAVYPSHGRHKDVLLRNADFAMYEAKRGGLDQKVVIYDESLGNPIDNPAHTDASSTPRSESA